VSISFHQHIPDIQHSNPVAARTQIKLVVVVHQSRTLAKMITVGLEEWLSTIASVDD
jgi:hypothetical protein